MSNSHVIGALFLIAERSQGKEFFLGRATGESDANRLSLEGKALLPDGTGEMTVQPFATRSDYRLDDSNYRIQRVDHPDAVDEVTRILTLAIAEVSRATFPLLSRWFQGSSNDLIGAPERSAAPFQHILVEFRASASRMRRALILSPQVTSPQELDRLVELEGDLVIEVGKVTSKVVTELNRMLENENGLSHFLHRVGDASGPSSHHSEELSGWQLVSGRLSAAKNWAIAGAETDVVRQLSALIHEGTTAIGQVLLEHQGALDTLASEAFGRYGIQPHTVEAQVTLSPIPSDY